MRRVPPRRCEMLVRVRPRRMAMNVIDLLSFNSVTASSKYIPGRPPLPVCKFKPNG